MMHTCGGCDESRSTHGIVEEYRPVHESLLAPHWLTIVYLAFDPTRGSTL